MADSNTDVISAAGDGAIELAQAQAQGRAGAAGESVGTVSAVEGQVTITRADGAKVPAVAGAAVFQGDLIETKAAGAVGITFADETTFSLADSGSLTIDEMVYDPGSQKGKSTLSVAEGVFTFVSGQIAKTDVDAMAIKTPVATIGIRGTAGGGKAGPEGTANTFSMFADPKGGVGEMTIKTHGGTVVFNQPLQTTQISSAFVPPLKPIVLPPNVAAQFYAKAAGMAPSKPVIGPAGGAAGGGPTGGPTGGPLGGPGGGPTGGPTGDPAQPGGPAGGPGGGPLGGPGGGPLGGPAGDQTAAQAFQQALAGGGSLDNAIGAAFTMAAGNEIKGALALNPNVFGSAQSGEAIMNAIADKVVLGVTGKFDMIGAGTGRGGGFGEVVNVALSGEIGRQVQSEIGNVVGGILGNLGIGLPPGGLTGGPQPIFGPGAGDGFFGPGPGDGFFGPGDGLGFGDFGAGFGDPFALGLGLPPPPAEFFLPGIIGVVDDTIDQIILGLGTVAASSNSTVITNLSETASFTLVNGQNDDVRGSGTSFFDNITLNGTAELGDSYTGNGNGEGADRVTLTGTTAPNFFLIQNDTGDTIELVLPSSPFAQNINFNSGGGILKVTLNQSGANNIAGTSQDGLDLAQTFQFGNTVDGVNGHLNLVGGGGDDVARFAAGTTVIDAMIGIEEVRFGNSSNSSVTFLSELSGVAFGSADGTTVTASVTLGGIANSVEVRNIPGTFTLTGGAGSDTFAFASGVFAAGKSADGRAGTDTLSISGSNNFDQGTLAGIEALTYTATATARFSGAQVNAAAQLASNLAVTGSSGTDTILVLPGTNATVTLANWTFAAWTAGTDVIQFDGLTGVSVDNITGSSQRDTIFGGGSADTLVGGAENDTFEFFANDFASGESVDGGTGTDTLKLFGTNNFSAGTLAGIEALTFGGGSTATFSGTQVNTAAQLASALAVTGSAGTDAIVVNLAAGGQTVTLANWTFASWTLGTDTITLFGNTGNDNITGSSQRDTIDGSGGADTLVGGAENDTFTFFTNEFASGESVDGGLGTDTLSISGSGSHQFGSGTLAGIEALTFTGTTVASFSGAQVATASNLASALAVTGSAGTDAINVNIAANQTVTLANWTFASWTAGTDTVDLQGNTGAENITGSSQADTIVGGAGADTLNGGDGDDIFLIAAAADHAIGEAINGGLGTADEIRFTSTTANETLTVRSGVSLVETVKISNASGATTGTTALNLDTSGLTFQDASAVTGNDGNNIVTMLDIQFDGSMTVNGNGGTDTLEIKDGGSTGVNRNMTTGAADITNFETWTLVSNVAYTLTLADANNTTGLTINGSAASAATIDGSAETSAALTVTGSGGADTLTGGAGADTLNGGAGADTLSGGDGNDAFTFAAGDFASGESVDGGAGTDTLSISGSNNFSLGTLAGIEGLTFAATFLTATFSGTQVNTSTQLASALAVQGTSNQTSTIVVNLSDAGQTVSLSGWGFTFWGAGAITVNGGAGADAITGSSQADTLNGGDGNDTLTGGAGGDTLTGGDGNDTLNGGEGADTIIGSSGADTISLTETTGAADIVRYASFGDGSAAGTAAGTFSGFDTITAFNTTAQDAVNFSGLGLNGTGAASVTSGGINTTGATNGLFFINNADATDLTSVDAVITALGNITTEAADRAIFLVKNAAGDTGIYAYTEDGTASANAAAVAAQLQMLGQVSAAVVDNADVTVTP